MHIFAQSKRKQRTWKDFKLKSYARVYKFRNRFFVQVETPNTSFVCQYGPVKVINEYNCELMWKTNDFPFDCHILNLAFE